MASPESLRRDNLSLLLRLLHRSGSLSRSEIGSALGMTRGTISELVNDLRSRGLVLEGDPARLGAPGRPSLLARPNPEGAAAIAAEIAINSLSAAVVGLGGYVLFEERITRKQSRVAVEAILEDIGTLIQAARAAVPPGCWVAGLGVSIPGVVRRTDGLVHYAPNLGWRDVPLGALMAGRLGGGLPTRIANDADLGALAEHTWGAGVGTDHLIFLSSEYGVGAGIIVDGRPLIGAGGCAGEVGHIQVNPAGVLCRCGAIGCWETEVGGLALLRHAGRAGRGYRPEVVNRLLEASSRGDDPAARAAVETVGRWLGAGLAGLINAFNPERVVLGGFLGVLWPQVEELVMAEVRLRAMAPSVEACDIRPSALGADASILGAAEMTLSGILEDPTLVPARTEAALAGSA